MKLRTVFLAAEIIRQRNREAGLTERYPWAIASIFGLFRGLRFAGALSEIVVPQHELPLALLMFNVGVESRQLLFIALVVSVLALLGVGVIRISCSAERLLAGHI